MRRNRRNGKPRSPVADGPLYRQAYRLSQAIEAGVASGRCHYRDKCGRLLRTLDEVVRAILADELRIA